jgi:AcrR family transcriptional regulator
MHSMTEDTKVRAPAHRPSRRDEIVAAAVRVFGRTGLADAGVQDIAEEAGVAPTAVYYHFSGKEELFGLALRRVLDGINAVVEEVRPDGMPLDGEALARVIDAVWDWLEEHPAEAGLFQMHLAGATGQAREVREEFESLHVERAFDYLPGNAGRGGRAAIVRQAGQDLAVRTLIKVTILVSTLRGAGGPLGDLPPRSVRKALRELGKRIVAE